MIKIKRFNESFRYPKQVNSQEFMKKKSTHKMVDFSTLERKQVREILYAKRCDYSFSGEYFEIHRRPPVEVVKYTDDWFTIIEGTSGPFYICDEFEEVLSYLRQL